MFAGVQLRNRWSLRVTLRRFGQTVVYNVYKLLLTQNITPLCNCQPQLSNITESVKHISKV